MKKIVFAAIAMFAMNASAEYVTEYVCNLGESGQVCGYVTYKVRPASNFPPEAEQCPVGESSYGPCPTEYGVPGWLQDLSQWATDNGWEAPAEPDYYSGGN